MKLKRAKDLILLTKNGYDRVASDWNNSRAHFWRELAYVKEYFKPGTNILDLGCGNGRFYEVIKTHAPNDIKYTGIDVSAKLISYAKEKYPNLGFDTYNGINLPYKDNSFDLIVSFAVWHHVPGEKLRVAWLRHATRTLSPGGHIILTVWNYKKTHKRELFLYFIQNLFNSSRRLPYGDIILGFNDVNNIRYIHSFSHNEIRKLFKMVGLKIIKLHDEPRSSGETNTIVIATKE